MQIRWMLPAIALVAFVPAAATAQDAYTDDGAHGKIPVTTASTKAHDLFVQGRDLSDRLRAPEGRALLEQAVEIDPGFASGWLALANAAGSNEAFFTALEKALATSEDASTAERMMIEALDAGVRGDPNRQLEILTSLAAAYPNDERVQNAIANNHFGRQDYDTAIAHYESAIAISPTFSPPYNSMGYAARAAGRYDLAEEAFLQYIEVLPGEPNPHDSYAEFLMKMGRYEAAVDQYRQALEANPTFTFSYAGIASNQMFTGDGLAARATLDEMYDQATAPNVRRNALLWKAASYFHEGNIEQATEALWDRYEIAQQGYDQLAMSNDHNQMGMAALWTGDAEGAIGHFDEAMKHIGVADVPHEVREATARNYHYNMAMVGIFTGDMVAANSHAEAYHTAVATPDVPFEIRQDHELMGRLAVADGRWDDAIAHLGLANQQDPRVLLAIARAHGGKGNDEAAHAYAARVVNFNQLSFPLSYVRDDALAMMAEQSPAGARLYKRAGFEYALRSSPGFPPGG